MADIRIPLTIEERRALNIKAATAGTSVRQIVVKLIQQYLATK